jgi:glycosyltransferase involved in cell wall biosynthesis
MNILYLVPHVPSSTKARSHFQVRGLLEAGHLVTVVTLQRSAQDARNIRRLQEKGVPVISVRLARAQSALNSLAVLPSRLPLQVAFMWSSALMRALERHLKDDPPDIIHIEHLRMARYGLRLVEEWPVIWDAVDHLASLYEQASTVSASLAWRLAAQLEAPRLRAYERWLTSQFPATLVISRKDQELFQWDNPYADRVYVVPLGLSMSRLSNAHARATDVLIITGTLDYHPNVASALYFVREVLPLIQRQRPDVRLQLVGAHPVRAIQALRSPQIEVTGFVPSLTDYLRKATIALAPVVYGSGIQIKVLEAFLTETPLVATSTALRGLDVSHDEHVLVADTPTDFADAVLHLLSDPGKRARIAQAGRRYLEQNHDLVVTTQRLVECYLAVQHQAEGRKRRQ